MLQASNFHLIPVDLPEVELDIVFGGGILMEVTFGLLEKEEVLLIGRVGLPIGMLLTVGGVVVALRCVPLRHL